MSWTSKQKMIAATACRQSGLRDEDRINILRQFPHAMHGGRVTSTSPRLTNGDFEQFMAHVERWAGGAVPGWKPGYWDAKSLDGLQRMRSKAGVIAQRLEAAGHLGVDEGGWSGLRGWIARTTHHAKSSLTELDYGELYNVIEGLKAFAQRRHVRLSQEA